MLKINIKLTISKIYFTSKKVINIYLIDILVAKNTLYSNFGGSLCKL